MWSSRPGSCHIHGGSSIASPRQVQKAPTNDWGETSLFERWLQRLHQEAIVIDWITLKGTSSLRPFCIFLQGAAGAQAFDRDSQLFGIPQSSPIYGLEIPALGCTIGLREQKAMQLEHPLANALWVSLLCVTPGKEEMIDYVTVERLLLQIVFYILGLADSFEWFPWSKGTAWHHHTPLGWLVYCRKWDNGWEAE